MKICTDIMESYDVGIFCLSYEDRSTQLCKKHYENCSKGLVLGYLNNNQILNYQKNKEFFINHNYEVLEIDEDQIKEELNIFFSKIESSNEISVLIDISSMTRRRVAMVIWNILNQSHKIGTITIAYSLASYTPPPESVPVEYIGSIIPELSGTPADTAKQTALIIGLGYENYKAIGAYNYIDPDFGYALIPNSNESKYLDDVTSKNDYLLNELNNAYIHYNVHDPIDIFNKIIRLSYDLTNDYRIVLLPLGPKILTAISVIVGYEMFPNLPIWRVSSEGSEAPIDRSSSGDFIYFTIREFKKNALLY